MTEADYEKIVAAATGRDVPTPSLPFMKQVHDDVDHPARYTKGKVECIDAIDSAIVEKPPDEAVCVANVIKYLWRYEEKEPVRSLRSAKWYLERLIEKVRRRTDTGYAVATETRQ